MLKDIQDCFVSDEDVAYIHEMSLHVLEEIGVAFEHKEVLEVFRKNGARIDGDKVFITESMVTAALQTVPRNFEVYGRGSNVFIGPDRKDPFPVMANSAGLVTYIETDNTLHQANVYDAIKYHKLTQTSDVLKMSKASSIDFPGLGAKNENKIIKQYALQLKYSDKPIASALRTNPQNVGTGRIKDGVLNSYTFIKQFYDVWDQYIVLEVVCPLSPLSNNYECLENVLGAAEGHQPITICTCSMTNVTAPPTLLGTIIQDNASILAMTVLIQLLNPGNPVIYCSLSAPSDMRSVQLSIGASESCLLSMATMKMARFYDMPARPIGAYSDAIDVDYQAGAESMMSGMAAILGRADQLTHAVGTLGSFNYGSFEKFVLDEEVLLYLKRLQQGINFGKDRDCFELMKEIGSRGSYIQRRTPKTYREEHYLSKLFHRKGSGITIRDEVHSLRDRATQEVNHRLSIYELPETTKAQANLLNKCLVNLDFKL
ncbi:MAG: trimethylamine methyltransferase family protein [Eubacterium sp.]